VSWLRRVLRWLNAAPGSECTFQAAWMLHNRAKMAYACIDHVNDAATYLGGMVVCRHTEIDVRCGAGRHYPLLDPPSEG
jgi:hypothetical protein